MDESIAGRLTKHLRFLRQPFPIVGRSDRSRIVDRVDLLKKGFLEIGQIEPLLAEHPGKPRYLLEGYYKIIYRIVDPQHVLILTVFDVRQDPERLIERFEEP